MDKGDKAVGWVILFFVLTIIAGALGFGIIAGLALGIAKIVFFLFAVAFIYFLVKMLIERGKNKDLS